MPTRRFVLGFDASPGAAAAIDWCAEIAPILDAEVVAVAVVDVVPFVGLPPADSPLSGVVMEKAEAMLGEQLDAGLAPIRDRGIPCRTMMRFGNPAAQLNEVATHEDADLIVVGRRGHGGFAEMLLGSVPHALAHHSNRPLVIVPRKP